jgi:hypothetical protein
MRVRPVVADGQHFIRMVQHENALQWDSVTVLICFSVCVGPRADSGIQILIQYARRVWTLHVPLMKHPPLALLQRGFSFTPPKSGAPGHRREVEL